MTKFVWLDIETTGLDPNKDQILELGIVITDQHLTVLDSRGWTCKVPDFEATLEGCSEVVFKMHQANGLWKEVRQSTQSIEIVESSACSFLKNHGVNFVPLCGSSVHFDRAFLKVHLPRLEKMFHHRHLDVSSLLIAWDLFGREKPAKAPAAHRAIADCKDSIAALASMRDGIA